jgi:hypothetical protein
MMSEIIKRKKEKIRALLLLSPPFLLLLPPFLLLLL